MQLPQTLNQSDDQPAIALLECYYGRGAHAHHRPFTGAWFDTWDSTGTRAQDLDRFTADDLIAVSFLSVDIPARAAMKLLDLEADAFADLLTELGPDRDLVQETDGWSDDWVGWRLWQSSSPSLTLGRPKPASCTRANGPDCGRSTTRLWRRFSARRACGSLFGQSCSETPASTLVC